MARTLLQNRNWWLDMAAHYERDASGPGLSPTKRKDGLARAKAARAHADTYLLPAPSEAQAL